VLADRLRRGAISIASSIAEGCGRHSDRELIKLLQLAMGSASEVEYELLLASDLGLLDEQTHERLSTDAQSMKRMLGAFLRNVRSRRRHGAPPRPPDVVIH
jgi:four helix bundle protein